MMNNAQCCALRWHGHQEVFVQGIIESGAGCACGGQVCIVLQVATGCMLGERTASYSVAGHIYMQLGLITCATHQGFLLFLL